MNKDHIYEVIENIKANPNLIKLTEEESNNIEIMREAILLNPDYIDLIGPKLADNEELILLALNNDPDVYKYSPVFEKYRDDFNITKIAVSLKGSSLEHASDRLKDNEEIVMTAIKRFGSGFPFASKRLRNDPKIAAIALSKNPHFIRFAGPDIKHDFDIMDRLLNELLKPYSCNNNLIDIPVSSKFNDNRDFILKLVTIDGKYLKYASDRLKNDREIVETALRTDRDVIPYIGDELLDNADFMFNLLLIDEETLIYASDRLRENPNFIRRLKKNFDPSILRYVFPIIDLVDGMNEVAKDPNSYKSLSKYLKNSFMIAEIAIKKNPLLIKYAGPDVKDNKELIIGALKGDKEFKINKKIVDINDNYYSFYFNYNNKIILEKLEKYESIDNIDYLNLDLEYFLIDNNIHDVTSLFENASDRLKNDKDTILEAFKYDSNVVFFIDKKWFDDEDFMIKAADIDSGILLLSSNNLRSNKEYIKKVCEKWTTFFAFSSKEIRSDKELIKELIIKYPYFVNYLSDQIRNDKDFLKELIIINNEVLVYLNPIYLNEKEFMMKLIPYIIHPLKYSPNLQGDEEYVLESVKRNGLELKYVDSELTKNTKIAIEAIKQNPDSLSFVDPNLKENDDFKNLVSVFTEKKEPVKEIKKDDFFGDSDDASNFFGEEVELNSPLNEDYLEDEDFYNNENGKRGLN